MSQVTYREAARSDVGRIVGFQVAMAAETEDLALDAEVCTRGVLGLFEDRTRGRYFLAEVDGTPVGSLMVTYEWSDWRAGMVWWIQSVYVLPEHRRKGLYAGLYRHVKQRAEADPGIRGLRLYVDQRNARAQEVYRRLGMNGDHYRVFEWMK